MLKDWYATFSDMVGVDPTDTKAATYHLPPIDSVNVWPLVSGQNSTSPRTQIPVYNNALIDGNLPILTDGNLPILHPQGLW